MYITENQELWLQTMESDQYQASDFECYLCTKNGLSPLGVACQISDLGEWWKNGDYYTYISDDIIYPSEKVMEWLGINKKIALEIVGMFEIKKNTFKDIAAAIRKHPSDYFAPYTKQKVIENAPVNQAVDDVKNEIDKTNFYKKYPLVLIEWQDIATWSRSWNPKDFDFDQEFRCISTGYLVNDGKKQKTIVPNFIGIHRKLDFRMGEITVIPTGCIRKITKLEEGDEIEIVK